MNPSTALATVLVDELIRSGVRDVALSPGSRNAPLAYALAEADAAGRLRLHVRIDERSAGFLALGLAKRTGRPTAVTCTSGSAAANLHPAVLEASHASVPLILLTADRPAELRDVGANQTVNQVRLYGDAVRFFHEIGTPEPRAGQNAYWRSLVCRAVRMATGSAPGPVHINVPLREPLVPDHESDWIESLEGREDGAPWTTTQTPASTVEHRVHLPARTLIVVGDAPPALGDAAAHLAETTGLPLVAEPSSHAWSSAALRSGSMLLTAGGDLVPDHVLLVGRPTLGRALGRLLRSGVDYTVVSPHVPWPDPEHGATSVTASLDGMAVPHLDEHWCGLWRAADKAVAAAVDEIIDASWPSGPAIARELIAALPADALIYLGSSSPIRDVDLAGARRPDLTVLANRGTAGIDGTVSTAVGAALDWQSDGGGRAFALLGDLTFLHDHNGLVIGATEPRPDLTIVVVNDDGGAIFSLLEYGEPDHAASFERVFGTPHGVDIAALCAATSTEYRIVQSPEELRDSMNSAPSGSGIRVVEISVDRGQIRGLHARIAESARASLL